MAMYRKDGEVQPHIKLGMFQLRIPFVHFRFEPPEFIQGLLLVAIPMSSITAHQDMMGIPFQLAIIMVTLNSLLYNVHVCLGDPVSAGWITPSIPLISAWGHENFPIAEDIKIALPDGSSILSGDLLAMSPNDLFRTGDPVKEAMYVARQQLYAPRIQAVIALGYVMGLIFLILGITGLGKKINALVPNSLRIGIILGAGVASVISVAGTRMIGIEIAVIGGMCIAFFTMYSTVFLAKVHTNKFAKTIARFGMLPGMVCACIIAYITKEVPAPVWDLSVLNLKLVPDLFKGFTIFGVGFPPASTFAKAIPMAITAYIIAFGDFIFAESVTKEADDVRKDESLAYNPNACYAICGARNIFLGTVSPYGSVLSGPLWGATHVSVVERYKHGRADMDSLFGGLWSLNCAVFLGTIWQGIVSFFKPCLQVGMSVTMMVQAYACFYMAFEMAHSRTDRAVGCVTAIFLAVKGATWGLVIGIILAVVMNCWKSVPDELLDVTAKQVNQLDAGLLEAVNEYRSGVPIEKAKANLEAKFSIAK